MRRRIKPLKSVLKGQVGKDWKEFAKRLKRLLRDAMRLRGRRESLTAEKYASMRERIENRMTAIIEASWQNGQAQRLVKRLVPSLS